MELKNLTDNDLITLAGLMREIIRADQQYSPAEHVHVDKLRQALGERRFDNIFAAAQEELKSLSEVKERAKHIEGTEARQLMYDYLKDLAAADGVLSEEEMPLRWLASWWALPH